MATVFHSLTLGETKKTGQQQQPFCYFNNFDYMVQILIFIIQFSFVIYLVCSLARTQYVDYVDICTVK